MQQRRHRRRDHTKNAQKDQHTVKAHDAPVIPVDPLHQLTAQGPQHQDLVQIVRGNRDVGHFSCNGSAGRNGNSGVRFRKGRRIIHAVPHHDDLASQLMLAADICRLVFGKYFGFIFVETQLCCHPGRRMPAVSRHHAHLGEARFVKIVDHLPGIRTQRILDQQHGRQLSVQRKIQMGMLPRKFFEPLLLFFADHGSLILKNKMIASDQDFTAVDGTGNAVGHHVFHLCVHLAVLNAQLSCTLHHGVGNGMWKMLFQAGRDPEHFRFVLSAKGDDPGQLRLCMSQRPGLIKYDGIGVGDGFHKFAALYINMMLPCLPHGRKHRNRHGQLQGAGVVYHQDCQGLADIPCQKPRKRRTAKTPGDQAVRQMRGPALGFRFQLFRFLDHTNDPVVAAAARYLCDTDAALSLIHHGPGKDRASGFFSNRQSFARHGSLIYRRVTRHDDAVQRDHISHAADHDIAGFYVTYRNQHFGALRLKPYLVDVQVHPLSQ